MNKQKEKELRESYLSNRETINKLFGIKSFNEIKKIVERGLEDEKI